MPSSPAYAQSSKKSTTKTQSTTKKSDSSKKSETTKKSDSSSKKKSDTSSTKKSTSKESASSKKSSSSKDSKSTKDGNGKSTKETRSVKDTKSNTKSNTKNTGKSGTEDKTTGTKSTGKKSSSKSTGKTESKTSAKSETKSSGKSSKSSSAKSNDANQSAKSSSKSSTKTSSKKSTDKATGSKQDGSSKAPEKSVKTSSKKSSSKQTGTEEGTATARSRTKSTTTSGGGTKSESSTKSSAKQTSTKSSKRSNNVANTAKSASTDSLTRAVNEEVLRALPTSVSSTGLAVNSVTPNDKKKIVNVDLNDNFTQLDVTENLINNIQTSVSNALPDEIASYRINLNAGKHDLSYYLKKVDRSVARSGKNEPFVKAVEPDVEATAGLLNDVLAMWHSHGRYFKGGGWSWQRPFLFETAEDVYTMSYMLEYIVPMLENAGAYVMLPRERDWNTNEVIVDFDTNPGGFIGSQPYYKETNGAERWKEGEGEGFIYDLEDFRDTENPFEGGTYREVKTVKQGSKPSLAGWYPNFPEEGEYAVYVSYKTLPNSTKEAHYTVNYSGGSKEFTVNQTMGGGTWIYLGMFPFEEGYSENQPAVVLTNVTPDGGKTVVTADAVKFGGGMGNIARSSSRRDVSTYSSKNISTDIVDDVDGEMIEEQLEPSYSNNGYSSKFTTSGMPRFVEGARYWLQWAGMPESVYSPHHGGDDYKDDYTSRGLWVNYLAGGSEMLPNRKGLNIPVDLSFALHSDAGVRSGEDIVGTLGICYTNNGAKLGDGTSRNNSRMLTDDVMRQIVGDIKATYEPNWVRRAIWDKSYLEAKTPEVPSTLIELMSHQNFGDMQYGLDPNFRFVVGRAIYKGIGRFLAERKGRKFIVQPLPVNSFMIQREGKGRYKLSWQPTEDKLEPTAKPTKYIVYERGTGDLGFRKVAEVKKPEFEVQINDTNEHSFKVVAANEGGVSFPSEVLALRESGKAPALIINGFTRVSAPGRVNQDGRAGFDSKDEFGVPYIRDISFTGHQTEFRRSAGNNWGVSGRDRITDVVAGNTFDFVAEHGASLSEAGYGYVSASARAVEEGKVDLSKYPLVDLILGKQKATTVGRGTSGVLYRAFPEALQQRLRNYVTHGGHLLVTGAYVGSDLYGKYSSEADREFAHDILGIEVDPERKASSNTLQNKGRRSTYKFNNTLNDKIYIVDHADVLNPVNGANELLEYSGSQGAAVSHKAGQGKVVTLGVPLETVLGEDARDKLMKELLAPLAH